MENGVVGKSRIHKGNVRVKCLWGGWGGLDGGGKSGAQSRCKLKFELGR